MKMPNVYIRIFSPYDDWNKTPGWDGESAAYVFLSFKSWEKLSKQLMKWDPDSDFYPATRSSTDRFRRWDMIATGTLQCDGGSLFNTYYPCSTKVRTRFRNKGYGTLLYKALIMAAIKHARTTKGVEPWVFGPHVSVGGRTSKSAMRVYPSLERKGYLIPASYFGADSGFYTPGKLPKNFKPIFY